MKEKLKKGFTALFTNDKFITAIILLNSVVIFLQESGFNTHTVALIDLICTLLFIIEMAVKQSALGLRGYWKDGWNRLDGTLVILSLPSIVAFFVPSQAVWGELSVLLVLRMLRILRFLRIIHIFPNFSVILRNFRKALKDSGGVFVGFFILIVIISLISCELFHSVSPEYFGTPIDSIYTIFRICTGEGWNEIPDDIAANSTLFTARWVRLYFSILLVLCSVIGLSLVNSIFVDAMVSDNNENMEKKIDYLNAKIDALTAKLTPHLDPQNEKENSTSNENSTSDAHQNTPQNTPQNP